MQSKERMIIDASLNEMKNINKKLTTTSGISDEMVVKHYLSGVCKDIVEIVDATEDELSKGVS